MTIDEMIAVLQAAKEGKETQYRCLYGDKTWRSHLSGQWNFKDVEYRVKPEPRVIYVPENDGRLGMYHYAERSILSSPERWVKFIEVMDE